jgi:anti-sigma regulatory factor (Ser/Thr protein kinase)
MEVRRRPLDRRETTMLSVEDASQVPSARRLASGLARGLDFDETTAGRAALVATELATNLVKHAHDGQMLFSAVEWADRPAVEILALDRGPGMSSVERCFEDGYSTAGSPGTGLGAVRRLALGLDVDSRPEGTAVLARIGASAAGLRPGREVVTRGISVPCHGEDQSGDAWDHERREGRHTFLVVDGLGHGPDAARSADACVDAFRLRAGLAPAARVEALHAALRATRGAAVAVVEIDPGRRVVRFAGLGNIAGSIHGDGAARHLVSHHGTAGHVARTIGEYTYPWPARALLIVHSDGLASLRHLERYPGLLARDPAVVAGVLYRDFGRRRDDATVLVVREVAA